MIIIDYKKVFHLIQEVVIHYDVYDHYKVYFYLLKIIVYFFYLLFYQENKLSLLIGFMQFMLQSNINHIVIVFITILYLCT